MYASLHLNPNFQLRTDRNHTIPRPALDRSSGSTGEFFPNQRAEEGLAGKVSVHSHIVLLKQLRAELHHLLTSILHIWIYSPAGTDKGPFSCLPHSVIQLQHLLSLLSNPHPIPYFSTSKSLFTFSQFFQHIPPNSQELKTLAVLILRQPKVSEVRTESRFLICLSCF